MSLRKFAAAAIILSLFSPFSASLVSTKAAVFTSGEINQVHHLQREYAALSKKNYNAGNIYARRPHLSRTFKAGSLRGQYIKTQLAYINYYRSLFGLPAISLNKTSNRNAQQTAAVMASINANPFINQHGLPSENRPRFIKPAIWKLAQDTSETSNLNFNVNNQSAGDVVTDLLTDHYNLTGSDTGHRAWLLSTRLSSTGIGAAYGKNGYRYSVQKVLNIDDLFRAASQAAVTYPSAGVFPIELLKGKNIAWSLYLSSKIYKRRPRITITDLDTKKTYRAQQVRNYSNSGYGNFQTVITYSPGQTPIIAGHEYKVNIAGLEKYTFKAFQQDIKQPADRVSVKAQTYQRAIPQKKSKQNSVSFRQNARLFAILKPKTRAKNATYIDALKKGQWQHNFFILHTVKACN